MKRALIVGALTAFALPVLAQEKGVTVNTSASSEGKPVSVVSSADGKAVPTVVSPVPARPVGSVELLSSAQTGGRLVFGAVPEVYTVLGLTDEQSNGIKALCKEAQAEFRQATMTDRSARMTPESFQKRTEKQTEITRKYELKIAETLTADQKTQLGKIKELAEQKLAEDKKISETAAAAYKTVLETYQKKLYAILPPEQAKKVEGEDQSRKQSGTGSQPPMMMHR
jgi:hypothetical protein